MRPRDQRGFLPFGAGGEREVGGSLTRAAATRSLGGGLVALALGAPATTAIGSGVASATTVMASILSLIHI